MCSHRWNLRTKPSQPIYKMKHKSAVTGLVAIDDFSLVSCCTDSRIALWDIRNNSKPVNYMSSPDGRLVLHIPVYACCVMNIMVLVCVTMHGLLCESFKGQALDCFEQMGSADCDDMEGMPTGGYHCVWHSVCV